MTIRAKFASTCRTCGGPVEVGQEVQWEKGAGVRHLPGQCVGGGLPVAPRYQQSRDDFAVLRDGGRVQGHVAELPGPDVVPAGRYAIENADGELRFYRVARGTRNPARVWLHVQHGPSESEVPFSMAGYRTILEAIVEAGPAEAAIRYGREIGACSTCGKRLTNALSRELGIGPVCGGRFYADEGEWRGIKDRARTNLRARGIDPDADLPDEAPVAVGASTEAPSAPVDEAREGRLELMGRYSGRTAPSAAATEAERDERFGEEAPF